MTQLNLQDFISKIDNFYELSAKEQVDYIAFYLTRYADQSSVAAKLINDTLAELNIHSYKRLPQYLSDESRARGGKYVKHKTGGYKLSGKITSDFTTRFDNTPVKKDLDKELTRLVGVVSEVNERAFLEEAMKCYQVSAYRAAIILIWLVSIDHLQNYIYANKLNEFNAELAKNPDKKVKKIVNKDDFSDLPENKFIELSRASGVISNDVRKILDAKLGIRNSAAHPSGVVIGEHKAVEFGTDLINNVILKYT